MLFLETSCSVTGRAGLYEAEEEALRYEHPLKIGTNRERLESDSETTPTKKQ